jgi:hypothetical protein
MFEAGNVPHTQATSMHSHKFTEFVKGRGFNLSLFLAFTCYKKAIYKINRKLVRVVLKSKRVPSHFITAIQSLHKQYETAIRLNSTGDREVEMIKL